MNKIAEIALAEIGTTENPANSNRTKYGVWFGLDSVPWCGIFVSWVYFHAGVPMPKIGFKTSGFAGTQTALAYFKEKGKIVTDPKQGDLVFFDFNGDGRTDHVAIYFEDSLHGNFWTIEGNTSLNNNNNGGTVMKRLRKTANRPTFVRP